MDEPPAFELPRNIWDAMIEEDAEQVRRAMAAIFAVLAAYPFAGPIALGLVNDEINPERERLDD